MYHYMWFGPFCVQIYLNVWYFKSFRKKSYQVCVTLQNLGSCYALTQIVQKMRCFLDKFTQLARILHDRRSWRSRQISTRSWIGLNLMFIGFVRAEKESAVAEGADLTLDLLPLGEKVRTLYFQQIKGKRGSCPCFVSMFHNLSFPRLR